MGLNPSSSAVPSFIASKHCGIPSHNILLNRFDVTEEIRVQIVKIPEFVVCENDKSKYGNLEMLTCELVERGFPKQTRPW